MEHLKTAMGCALLAGCLTFGNSWVEAQVTASVNEQDYLVIEGTNVELFAIEFRSASGSLISSEIAMPFDGVLRQDNSLALYYSLGTPLLLNGSLRLDTRWNNALMNDVLFQYGTRDEEFGLQPIREHVAINGQVGENPVIVNPTGEAGTVGGSEVGGGGYSSQGGQLSDSLVVAALDDLGIYLLGNELSGVTSLTIRSQGGFLQRNNDVASLHLANSTPFEIAYTTEVSLSLSDRLYLPVSWHGETTEDLSIDLTTDDGATLTATVDVFANVPEPTLGYDMLGALCVLALRHSLRKNGRQAAAMKSSKISN